jgi:hypothetical protein
VVRVSTQTVADILRVFHEAQGSGGVVLEYSLVGDQALVLTR